jgi:tRNA(Arg) A34 adenosine deaminase TadA
VLIGAVIVRNGTVAAAHNHPIAPRPSAHAELLAIRRAAFAVNYRLRDNACDT